MLIDILVGLAVALNALFIAYAADMYLTQQQVEWAPLILTGASVVSLLAFFMTKGE